jgi:hypothetical protein
VCICTLQLFQKKDKTTSRMAQGHRSGSQPEFQSQGPTSEACSSRRSSRMRPAATKTPRVIFGCQGMSRIGNVPRSTRASEISMTNCDSSPASTVHSSSTLATSTRVPLAPSIDPTQRRNAGRAPASPPVSPPAFRVSSPVWKGGSSAPPTSSQS